MKIHQVFAVVCFSVFLVVLNHVTFAEEFPDELRVVAKSLADDLYSDLDEALKEHNPQEVRLEMQMQKFDLAKIKADNAEIQHLASEALTAVSDAIKRLETIDDLPKPNHWKSIGAAFLDGFLLGSLNPPTGLSISTYQSENAKEKALYNEIKGLMLAVKKTEIAQRLLPRVAKPYAATETKSKNGDSIYVEFHEFPCLGDLLIIKNIGKKLQDCVLEVKITGEQGETGTSVFFVEKFESEQTFVRILANGTEFDGEMIGRRTAHHVKKAEMTLLSPKYSTSVAYEYGQKERDDDYALILQDVKLTARYSEAREGVFTEWRRSATIYMHGVPWLPPCILSVTFDGEDNGKGKTYTESYSGWSEGAGRKVKGNNRLEDKCKSFRVEVTFPRTNFKINGTWPVD
ncbi:MAG: hypothetical protein ACRC10_10840 [Thermoguttaceae bacterium]